MSPASTLLRLCGIAVGVITLLGVLDATFKPVFRKLLQLLVEAVDTPMGWVDSTIVQPFLELGRSLGLLSPQPVDNWRAVAIVFWLLMLSSARSFPGRAAGKIIWAFACAVVASIALSNMGRFLWSFVALFVFAAGLLLPAYFVGRVGGRELLESLVAVLFFSVSAFVGVWAAAALGLSRFIFFESHQVVFFYLVPAVGFAGLVELVVGLSLGGATHPRAAAGIDILCTIGGALAIGWLMKA